MKKEKIVREYYKIYGSLMSNAYFLTDYGWDGSAEVAWSCEYVYDAIKVLEKKNILILGGDVCIINNDKIVYTYDNWVISTANDNTNISTFDQTIRYINEYISRIKNQKIDIANYLFIITCDFTFLRNDNNDILYIH